MTVNPQEWYIIVNPHAGSGKTMSEWAVAEAKLAGCGVPYKAVFTARKYHATELAHAAASQGWRKFVAVGGDGSVHEVMCGVVDWCRESGVDMEEFTLAVIPIGSGNDWIKSLNVPHDTAKVVELIANESFAKQDVIAVELADGVSTTMTNVGGVGFDSHVCVTVNALKDRGRRSKLLYVYGLVKAIIGLKSIRVRIEGDGREIFCGTMYSVAFGNGKYSGSGMLQTPLSELDDELIDVMVVPRIALWKILLAVPRIFTGTLAECRYVIYAKARSITVTPLDDASADLVEVDGEVTGKLPMSLKATGSRINVVVGR